VTSPLLGLMQDDFPLSIDHILWRMRTVNHGSEVVTLQAEDGTCTRASMAEVAERAGRLAAALARLGIVAGDRVATFAWNTQQHLEAYYAVPCLGAVLHTLNIRLFPEQVAAIANHAGDRVVILDDSLVPLMERVAPSLETVEWFVVIGDGETGSLPNVLRYEELLAAEQPGYAWPGCDERSAAVLCYTSGTTGSPKGVLYSHRSIALHALLSTGVDTYRLSRGDRVLAVVPMFHAMAWGLPYSCGLTGAALVMPNRFLQSPALALLIEQERTTYACGVPTIWLDLLRYADEHGSDLSSLKLSLVGGSQVPLSLMQGFEQRHGVQVIQGWGMTEAMAGAAIAHAPAGSRGDRHWAYRSRAGRLSPFVEGRIVDDAGDELPWDGQATGELEIRGPWVARGYFAEAGAQAGAQAGAPAAAADVERMHDGWLRTGDVAALDPEGWLRITDRAKDVIKSGGEWISSVDLESALMAHPRVREAAVIARPDDRWSERPLACVVVDGEVSASELRGFLTDRVVKWWLPDDFAFLDELPRTSTGKFDKKTLRSRLAAGELPGCVRARTEEIP